MIPRQVAADRSAVATPAKAEPASFSSSPAATPTPHLATIAAAREHSRHTEHSSQAVVKTDPLRSFCKESLVPGRGPLSTSHRRPGDEPSAVTHVCWHSHEAGQRELTDH